MSVWSPSRLSRRMPGWGGDIKEKGVCLWWYRESQLTLVSQMLKLNFVCSLTCGSWEFFFSWMYVMCWWMELISTVRWPPLLLRREIAWTYVFTRLIFIEILFDFIYWFAETKNTWFLSLYFALSWEMYNGKESHLTWGDS